MERKDVRKAREDIERGEIKKMVTRSVDKAASKRRGRASEFELLKANERFIPCQLGEGLSRTDTLVPYKRSDLAAQSATSSSTGGPTMRSRIIIMSVRTYPRPVRPVLAGKDIPLETPAVNGAEFVCTRRSTTKLSEKLMKILC